MKKIIVSLVLLLSLLLTSCSSVDLYIGENGNWWNGDEDLGIVAQGPQGEQGIQGVQGEKGDTGEPGKSVSVVSVTKTKTEGSVDTYTISFSDNSSTSFTVTNGTDGTTITITSVEKVSTEGLIDTYQITFSDDTSHIFTVKNGEDGKSVTVSSIGKTSSVGLVDTYEIVFSDGTKSTFTVTNGRDGNTPYIGANGNWWIDDKDTGVLADYSADDRKISDGLFFLTTTVGGKAGMVVSDYKGTDVNVVIPNYVGSVPVIGINSDVFDYNTNITSISLSKNTVWLGESAFEGCSKLETVDFNGAELTEISAYAFKGCAIKTICLPQTVTKLGDYAFSGCPIANINYEKIVHYGASSLANTKITSIMLEDNVEYIGASAFNSDCLAYAFISDSVEYVGKNAFDETFVFIESETIPNAWDSSFHYSNYYVVANCFRSDDYIYSVSNGNAVIHRYIGSDKRIILPSQLNGYSVTEIGCGFESYNDIDVYDLNAYYEITLEEIIIPDSVTKINGLTFWYSRAFIYIPDSVTSMEWSGSEENFKLAFYAFEKNEYPFDYEEDIRIAYGVDFDKIVYDDSNNIYLYEDLYGYSVLASVVRMNESITIPSQYIGKTIHTINSWSIFISNGVVKILDGVNKIKKYGVIAENGFVYVPQSVSTINADGISATCCLVEVNKKPDDWDSNWFDGNGSDVLFGFDQNVKASVEYQMLYQIENGSITLIEYFGTSATLYIPREIEGYTVTKIAAGFYTSSSTRKIYIPKEIEVIESKAFTNSGYNTYYFYIERAERPIDWSSDWYYYSISGNYTSGVSKSWNQNFSY